MADLNLSNDLLPTIDVLNALQGTPPLRGTPFSTTTPFGPKSTLAARTFLSTTTLKNSYSPSWSDDRVRTAVEQIIIVTATRYDLGTIDGLIGPRTTYALELYQNISRDKTLQPVAVTQPTIVKPGSVPQSSFPTTFPRQKNVPAFYGPAGSADAQALLSNLPFKLRMDGSLSKTASIPLGSPGAPTPITRLRLHKTLHANFLSILNDIVNHYGLSQIASLGLDQFAGSYNYRPMRGGSNLSMHAYGIAVDFDAQRNTLHETARTARFARPEYKPFLDIFYDHGWISLGRERNFDWMHFQAASL